MKKNKLSKAEIIHLANLSKLKLTEEEIQKYRKQLEETVDYIDNLNELNTAAYTSIPKITKLFNVMFNDGLANTRVLSQVQATANSQNKKNGYFVVKRIMR